MCGAHTVHLPEHRRVLIRPGGRRSRGQGKRERRKQRVEASDHRSQVRDPNVFGRPPPGVRPEIGFKPGLTGGLREPDRGEHDRRAGQLDAVERLAEPGPGDERRRRPARASRRSRRGVALRCRSALTSRKNGTIVPSTIIQPASAQTGRCAAREVPEQRTCRAVSAAAGNDHHGAITAQKTEANRSPTRAARPRRGRRRRARRAGRRSRTRPRRRARTATPAVESDVAAAEQVDDQRQAEQRQRERDPDPPPHRLVVRRSAPRARRAAARGTRSAARSRSRAGGSRGSRTTARTRARTMPNAREVRQLAPRQPQPRRRDRRAATSTSPTAAPSERTCASRTRRDARARGSPSRRRR